VQWLASVVDKIIRKSVRTFIETNEELDSRGRLKEGRSSFLELKDSSFFERSTQLEMPN